MPRLCSVQIDKMLPASGISCSSPTSFIRRSQPAPLLHGAQLQACQGAPWAERLPKFVFPHVLLASLGTGERRRSKQSSRTVKCMWTSRVTEMPKPGCSDPVRCMFGLLKFPKTRLQRLQEASSQRAGKVFGCRELDSSYFHR